MLKICHIVIFEYYHEGYSYQENLLSQKHRELGYDVSVIAAEDDGMTSHRGQKLDVGSYVNEHGINVYVLPRTKHNVHFKRFFKKCIGLYKKLEELNPDIIFVHNFRAWDVIDIALYLKNHQRVKLYVDSHDDYYNFPQNNLKNKIEAFEHRIKAHILLPFTEKFWGTLPWRELFLKEVYHIPKQKIGLLIMGADESKIVGRNVKTIRANIRQEYSIPLDAFLVTTGGRIDKRKQQDLLMEAVSNLACKNVWLLVFGSPTKEMEAVCNKYKVYSNIVFTGWVPSDKAYDFFIASDLAYFPGTHSVLWEQAAACATPIVVKYWKWISHIKINENACLMMDITTKAIVDSIMNVSNPETYQKMKIDAISAAPNFYLKEISKVAIGCNNKTNI